VSYREGALVNPYERLTPEQIELLDRASLDILADPGFTCGNKRVIELFRSHGATIIEKSGTGSATWQIQLPRELVKKCVAGAPSAIVLGARDPNKQLLLDAAVPRVYFGSGSETNIWIETEIEEFAGTKDPNQKIRVPVYKELRGSARLLCRAARICDQLDHLDFFIRPVNVQDPGVDESNHDVNKFFASLNNITKHVQAGLTQLESLKDVLRMAEIIAGGPEALQQNPLISFIACVFKSPLQIVSDTADKVFSIVEAGMPIVISSSPQGGSTAPIQEAGMVAQINAEILAGITLTQLIRPGAPVLYGSVPVRARMDDLHDFYGCPEFNQYNTDCVQLARHYKVPCYSTAGVADAKVPGMQAAFEKLLTHQHMAMTGAQYVHYAFGLLDRTSAFCPVQAVIDNEHIGKIKHALREPKIDKTEIEDMIKIIRKVTASGSGLYTRHVRKAQRRGDVSSSYLFETHQKADTVIERAVEELNKIESKPACLLDRDTVDTIYAEIPGLLPELKQHL